jgi:hypothetical protein
MIPIAIQASQVGRRLSEVTRPMKLHTIVSACWEEEMDGRRTLKHLLVPLQAPIQLPAGTTTNTLFVRRYNFNFINIRP